MGFKCEEMYYTKRLHLSDFIRIFLNLYVYIYVLLFFITENFREILEQELGHKTFNSSKIKSCTVIPVPPLSEQKRIAEKINELMGLVDVIEQNKTDLQTAVKLAKEKILDLAIRGQLVPQNPDDEPASVLLERIRAEKQQLIQQGKIKPDKKDTVTFTDDELPFELPDGWEWCRLGQFMFCIYQKEQLHKVESPDYLDSGFNYLRVGKIVMDETGK